MTRSEFNMAFNTVIAEEFADIPDESEIEVEFSDEFNRKMQELIDSIGANDGQKPKSSRKSRLNIKGLIALAATLALLLAGLVSVNAAENPLVNFIVKTYEDFKEILFAGDGAAEIDHVYAFAEVPEGFVETKRISNEEMNMVRYENSETGAVIELRQSITDGASFALDSEKSSTKALEHNGKEITVCCSETSKICEAFWIEDECRIKLICSGVTNCTDLLDMVDELE